VIPPSVERIDKFEVLRRLGRGGMGSVYLARDPDIERLVAIKLLHEGFDEGEVRGRFTTEAKSASALRHTNIVTIFQTGTFLERPFIVMEYVAGQTFADIVAGGRSPAIGETLLLLDQLLAGLQYAHAKGIVHRDIKPSNVMVDAEGVVRILDFGIARLGDGGGLTRTGVMLGTINYMAPEQLAGKPVDARADIFAFGLVAYELVSSKAAFPQAFPEVAAQIAFHAPPSLQEVCPGIDSRLTAIVERCLEKQPDDRYPDCAAVRRDLDAVRQAPGASGADTMLTAVRPVAVPAPLTTPASPVAADLGSDTVRIDRRRPSPQVAPTPAAPVTAAHGTRRPARLAASAGAGLLIIAIAVVAWRAAGDPPVDSARAVNESGATPVPQPASAVAPEVPRGRGATPPPQPVEPAAPLLDGPRATPTTRRSAPPPTPVRVGGAIEAPKLLRRVSPEYPSMARSARLQGVVVLEATIGTDGKVTNVRVVRSIPLLDTAAADAVRQWEYEPTIVKGVAVPVITSVAVEFKLTPPAPVRVGGDIRQPTKIRHVEPNYPAEAQAAGAQGVVILEATIGVDGKVTGVRVLRSIPLLDKAASDAVQQWQYTPTLLNDVPVPVLMTVTVNFTLTPPAPATPPPTK
jgi:serine/threonine-protein kinase